MNRKREDELLQLAFGDIRREESSRLQSELNGDPEAAKAYGAYCEMREGLKALREVPEMQLSTERLREAILRDGLQPRKNPVFNWSWLATPIAVGACAFVVVSAMRKPADVFPNTGSNGPVAFQMNEPNTPPTISSLGNIDFGATDSVKLSRNANTGTADIAAKPVSETKEDRPVRRRSRARGNVVAMLDTTTLPGLAKSLSVSSSAPANRVEPEMLMAHSLMQKSSFSEAKAAPMALENVPSGPSSSIVQIDSKVDTETGAARAVEVKGVEIGG